MADDAGALLVRSGLVTQPALEQARLRVMADGGTIGEQLVADGVVSDETLTEFYRARLLVPQVNPNTLARLPQKVVGTVPADMAVELRAVPVSLDSDNNLTVAMSDPSDRHAVDEIAFFTGTYVVRAVATQMQIAWCLAHYYGHVTMLGERLLKPDEPAAPAKDAGTPTRKKGITEQVKALRTKRLERGAVMANDVMSELQGKQAVVRPSQPEVAAPDATKLQPVVSNEDAATPVDTPKSLGRDASGEIASRTPRAQSIRPPYPEDSGPVIAIEAYEPSGPVITIEAGEPSGPIAASFDRAEDITERKKPMPKRKRPAEPDPPELAARAGEVQLASGEPIKAIDFDVLPSIMISDELERALRPSISGELAVRDHREGRPTPMPSVISVELQGTESGPAIIREQVFNEKSEPVLLERRRPSEAPTNVAVSPAPEAEIDPDDEVSDVVVLEQRKPLSKRIDKITQVGIGPVPAATSKLPLSFVTAELEDTPTDAGRAVDADPTRVDAIAAPAADDDTHSSDDHLAAPPAPADYGGTARDTLQIAVVPPPEPTDATPPPSGAVSFDNVQRALSSEDDEDEDDIKTKPTMVMSAVELDEVIPERMSDPLLARRKPAAEPADDGWGPPGTTIPPTLLGAIPGTVEPVSGGSVIPISDVDSAPLMIAPPTPPQVTNRPHTASEQGVARVLEESTARVLELIRTLEHATERDQVIAVMIAHLAESHQRAGFFAARSGELTLFAIAPRVPAMPAATLRLDRPSTFQDVVGTRLPYRGPMHDDASRTFITAILGACPAELLLVPIAVRERVVGVLFGDHRVRHTFDDQLALAARAAGMALERILKARRA